ncbi:hypothetical protein HDE_13277 [Halotydeus destructor]|nr:hypothetical protein HDE_13277 [Halotydeus destructor]
MNDLYFTLPSNSPSVNNANTVASYRTTFEQPLSLPGKWEVALRECHIPFNWRKNEPFDPKMFMILDKAQEEALENFNFAGQKHRFAGIIEESFPLSEEELLVSMKVYIKSSKIKSFQQLKYNHQQPMLNTGNSGGKEIVEALNIVYAAQIDLTRPIVFELLEDGTVTCTPGLWKGMKPDEKDLNIVIWPDLPESIREIMGVTDMKTDIAYAAIQKLKMPALIRGSTSVQRNFPYHVYCYCDAVEPVRVGHTKTQLLRTVEVPSDDVYGSLITRRFQDSYYLPVQGQELTSILVEWRYDYGSLVPFTGGRSLVVLHFRKRN